MYYMIHEALETQSIYQFLIQLNLFKNFVWLQMTENYTVVKILLKNNKGNVLQTHTAAI